MLFGELMTEVKMLICHIKWKNMKKGFENLSIIVVIKISIKEVIYKIYFLDLANKRDKNSAFLELFTGGDKEAML